MSQAILPCSTNTTNTINEWLTNQENGILKYEALRLYILDNLYKEPSQYNLCLLMKNYLNSTLIGASYSNDGSNFKKNGSVSTNAKFFKAELFEILNTTFGTQVIKPLMADFLAIHNNTGLPQDIRTKAYDSYGKMKQTLLDYQSLSKFNECIGVLEYMLMEP